MRNKIISAVIAAVVIASGYAFVSQRAYRGGNGAPTASAAAVDYYLKLGDIKGESTDRTHKDEIDIMSWSWGMSQTGTVGTGKGAAKVNVQNFPFTKLVDKASPVLLVACASGKHYPEAKLTVRKAGGEQQEYLMITMQDVVCSSLSLSGSQSELPTESVSLNFSKIKMEYKPINEAGVAGGSVTGGWDVKKNTKF